MIKLDKFTYRVQRGEVITITAKLQGLPGNAVSIGEPWTQVPNSDPPQFTFTIPQGGTDTVFPAVLEVSFVRPEAGAKADISLKGSNGGGPFTIPTITKDSIIKDPGFTFWVM